jgi:2'-5' RNA ligase
VDRWHLTVRFIGEVPDDRRAEIERVLDSVPLPVARPRLRLAGGGRFWHGRSTVLWAGVEGDVAALAELHDAVGAALGAEPTGLVPHVTVAYARSAAVRDALIGYVGPPWTVAEIVLIRSNFRTGGGYENLRTWPIAD